MGKSIDELKILLWKYSKNIISRNEVRRLVSFFDGYRHRKSIKKILGQQIKIHFKESSLSSESNNEVLFQTISERIDTTKAKKYFRLRAHLVKIKRLVAFIFLFISLSGILFLYFDKDSTSQKQELITKSVPFKAVECVDLPDGSSVWLKAGSCLKYPKQFSEQEAVRKVYLEGEAFFRVISNPHFPFVIHTKDFKTRVLGTSFNIQTYQESNQFAVTVKTGTVKVNSFRKEHTNPEEIVVTKNQKVSLSKAKILEVANDVDLEMVMAWMDGEFMFKGMTLEEVIVSIEQWFGVDIELKEKRLGSCIISGRHSGQDLETILETLKQILDIEYKYVNKRLIELDGGHCFNL